MTSSAHMSQKKSTSLFKPSEIRSTMVRRLPPYLFARINDLKMEKRRRGEDIIDLGMGNPNVPTPDHIVDKLVEVAKDPKAHRYSASRGIPHLRKAITRHYKEVFNVDLDPDEEAIVTIGSKEGFVHLLMAILNPGDVALVPNPTYPIHDYGVIIAGGDVIHMPVTEENNYRPDLKKALQYAWPEAKLLILNYPANPTTATTDLDFFKEVVEFAHENRVIVIHDNAYAEVTFDGYKAPSFLQVPGAREVGVEFCSMSKTYSMAGWRVGFCLGNAEIIKTLAHLKSYMDYGIFTPIQVASILALTGDQSCIQEIAKIYQRRRDLLCDQLCSMGWEVQKPKAGMFVWAPIPKKYQFMNSMDFSIMLMEKAGVCVSPGLGFGVHGEGFVRIAMVENEDRIKQALRNIKKIM